MLNTVSASDSKRLVLHSIAIEVSIPSAEDACRLPLTHASGHVCFGSESTRTRLPMDPSMLQKVVHRK
jgi:hypothetical protein